MLLWINKLCDGLVKMKCIEIFSFIKDEQIINKVNLGLSSHRAVNKLGKLHLFSIYQDFVKIQSN